MASPLTIPEGDIPIVRALADLEQRKFDVLLSALSETAATLSQGRFVKQLSEKAQGLDPSEIGEIARVVFILYRLKDRAQISAQKLAEDVSASVFDSGGSADSDKKRLAERLLQILGFNEGIAVTAKAMDVMTEHQRTFCAARILSDIRPIFTGSGEAASAAVIIHTLQIGFHEGGSGDHKQFYVALDQDDLRKLKDQVSRAEKKNEALRSILKSANIQYLDG